MTKAIEDGWEVEHDFGDRIVLIRRSFGSTGMHILIGFFTIWWTMGIGNALYAAYCYYSNAERRVLWADQSNRSNEPAVRAGNSAHDTVESSSSGNLGTTILLWLGALIMVAAAQTSATILWTVIFGAVAIILALSGTSSLSPVRRRLEKRQSITDNGWTRSVRERSVVNPDETCAACAGHVGRGVERTYSTEFAVLGVPLTTDERGTNYYCRRCANGEVPMAKPDPDSDSDSDSELESESESDTDSESRSKQAHESDLQSDRDSNRDRPERSDGDRDEKQEQKRSQHADQNQTEDDIDTSVDHERTSASHGSDHDHDHDREQEHERNTELS
ncbi:zinc ribbon domain-containing protein [Halomontanus rarus]|uniref:zinc ribbon domain-containing protein n=1 Tax=Halomontanus rarus TaxID=3034020 RepID=UPI0023E872E6|nr:zinc ribbon domain-containing protein [Halovivax sp. TS33]